MLRVVAFWHVVLVTATMVCAGAALADATSCVEPVDSMHAFYYLWYGTVERDGRALHWDHRLLPHWDASQRERHPHSVSYAPPASIGSPFFPARGLYSSSDPSLLAAHMRELGCAGVGVAVASWTGRPDNARAVDGEGVATHANVAALARVLDADTALGVRLAIHIEPYEGRTAASVADDVRFLLATVVTPRNAATRESRPVFYVYDSYHVSSAEWATVLRPDGAATVRGNASADGFFFGLCLARGCVAELVAGGFDGLYTYFGSDGFTYGATTREWASIVREARAAGLAVSLSVGPGYDDTRIRPWNAATRRAREDGAYYKRMLDAAASARADVISITSFNEWGEGTQIEPARARACIAPPEPNLPCEYDGYGPGGETAYMDLTREAARQMATRAGLAHEHEAL